MIWARGLSKRIRRIAVHGHALASDGDIAQQLIVSRVLFVDKDNVLDLPAGHSVRVRNRNAGRGCRAGQKAVVLQNPRSVGLEQAATRNRNDIYCAYSAGFGGAVVVIWGSAAAARIGNEKCIAVGAHLNGAGPPPHWDVTFHMRRFTGQSQDANGVNSRFGNVQPVSIWTYSQRDGLHTFEARIGAVQHSQAYPLELC